MSVGRGRLHLIGQSVGAVDGSLRRVDGGRQARGESVDHRHPGLALPEIGSTRSDLEDKELALRALYFRLSLKSHPRLVVLTERAGERSAL
jgi:hypothetical protein